jgi:hypothetical protein
MIIIINCIDVGSSEWNNQFDTTSLGGFIAREQKKERMTNLDNKQITKSDEVFVLYPFSVSV